MPRAQRPGLGNLGGDGLAVDIVLEVIMRMLDHAVLADLGDPLRACHQTDDESAGRHLDLWGKRHARHERHIGGLEAALGEIDRRRRLGRAADADQHDIGIVEIRRQMAVIVQHSEVERLDAPEIVGVEYMLAPHRGGGRRSEIGFEDLQDRLERGHAGNIQPLAGLLELFGKLTVEEGIEHDPGRCLHVLHHPLELAPAADQRMQVLDRPDLGVLHPDRLGDGGEGLAGRVGDHMEVESSLDIHGNPSG